MVVSKPSWERSSQISHPSALSVNEDSQFISLRPKKTMSNSTNRSIRHFRSLPALDDRHTYDVRVGYSKKKMPVIGGQYTGKAKVVNFYRNGDSYFGGTKVTIHPEKYFKTLGSLQDFLSQRLKIPQGVRYIFKMSGRLVEDIDELEDGESYVASGTKTFQEMDYGKLARLRTGLVTAKVNPAPLRPDDIKLLRPVSPSERSRTARRLTPRIANVRDSGVVSLPGSRESCVVTVVNNYDHSIKSRVLLNLRTNQSFEDVLEDMGQSIKIKKATRMLTPWGEEVRGYSHLRNELFEVETFYLDCGDLNMTFEPRESTRKRTKQVRNKKPRQKRSSSASKVDALVVGSGPSSMGRSGAQASLKIRINDDRGHRSDSEWR